MSQIEQKRRERAAAGSRRKRDLGAAEPSIDWGAWIAEHFPVELADGMYGYVLMHAQRLYCRQPKRIAKLPTPAEVRERMESFGHARERFVTTGESK